MNDTVSDLRVRRREAHIASAGRIHSAKCVHTVAGSSLVPYRSVCAPAGFARESDTNALRQAPHNQNAPIGGGFLQAGQAAGIQRIFFEFRFEDRAYLWPTSARCSEG